MKRRTPLLAGFTGLLLTIGLAAGCGSSESGRFGAELDAVDSAVVANDPTAIRSAVGDLRRAVQAAVAAGEITETRGAQIIAAARQLLSAMPTSSSSTSTSTPTSTPTSEPTPTPTVQTPPAQPPGGPGKGPGPKKDKPPKKPKGKPGRP